MTLPVVAPMKALTGEFWALTKNTNKIKLPTKNLAAMYIISNCDIHCRITIIAQFECGAEWTVGLKENACPLANTRTMHSITIN